MNQKELNEILTKYQSEKTLIQMISLIIVLGILLFSAFIVSHYELGLPLIMMVIFLGIFILVMFNYSIYRKYNDKFKTILKDVIQSLYPNIRYEGKADKIKNLIIDSNLFSIEYSYSFVSSDYLIGKFENYDLYTADIYSYYVVSTGKSTTTVPVFKGRWIMLDIHKKFDFNLVIREEGNFFKGRIKGDLKKFDTESISFNEKFNIYTNDELKTLRTIKPQQIIKIQRLEQNYHGRLAVGINNDLIHLAIWDDTDELELRNTPNIDKIKTTIDNIIIKANEIYNILK